MIKKYFILLFQIILFLFFVDCRSQSFNDIAAIKGIIHKSTGLYGGGVSFVDFNNDGWDDITLGSDAGDSILFYSNNNGSFVRIYPQGIDHIGESKQLLWVDFDNDGDKDLFVTTRNDANRLYENLNNFTFKDITIQAGLPILNDETFAATFGDINNDGYLDLYIGNYNYSVYTNYLFLNNGSGRFVDITAASGTSDSIRFTFSAVFVDINKDGFQDLYVGNDKVSRNSLYLNNGNNTFTDISTTSNTGILMDAMGIAVGDFDNNYYPDLYISNNSPGNVMLKNDTNQTFSDVSISSKSTVNELCWGVNFFDFDNDSDLDLYVCNEDPGIMNTLLINNNNTFSKSMSGIFRGDTLDSYGNAIGDLDNNGFSDILVANNLSDVLLLHNSGNSNRWVKVELEGVVSNREGIGSTIEVFTSTKHSLHTTHCGIGFQAQNSATYVIGLNQDTLVDSMVINWPSGFKDVYYNLSANQKYHIKEGGQLKVLAKLVTDTNKICQGDSLTISLEIPFKKYNWSNGDSSNSIVVKNPGMYYASLENQFGLNITSDTIVVDTFTNSLNISTTSSPATDENSKDGYAVVTVNGGYGKRFVIWNDKNYQTSDTAHSLSPGRYKVVVRDEAGCFRIDHSEVGFNVGKQNSTATAQFLVFPNPTKSNLIIRLPEVMNGQMELHIFDMRGVEIENKGISPKLSKYYELDLQGFRPGNYFIVLVGYSQTYTATFTVHTAP